jgi:hypothetical protein
MVCSVDTADQRDLFCPRCRYNLRGLPTPRCPECGLTFTPAEWQAGVLREHIPTSLDCCDPWQPHQVLLRSLYELVHGALRPGWLVAKLDLNGSLRSAGLMIVFGVLWLYILVTALVAVAVYLHTGASPFASLISAAVCWAPQVLVVALVPGAATHAIASLPPVLHINRLSARQHLRLAAYWVPAAAVYVALPLAALLATPDLVLGQSGSWPGLMLTPLGIRLGIIVVHRLRRAPPLTSGGVHWVFAPVLALAGGGALSDWLAGRLLPTVLDPPLWVYF